MYHPSLNKMEYIDVFSGIGGIDLALAPFVKPILYCEWDKYCQQVLVDRMRDGDLARAPIHADIKTLHPSPYMKPKMIGGGFPCQDISTAGAQIGMAGDRSSLFFEIMRIVDEAPSIDHVFLENVANIVKCGFQEVLEELSKRGFNMVWTTRSAASMGAPHQRSRWFCLASRNPDALKQYLDTSDASDASNATYTCTLTDMWAVEWPRRITIKSDQTDPTWDPNWIARSHTLGNTVVPCVVRAAFVELAGVMSRLQLVTDAMSPYAVDATTALASYPFPESGILEIANNKYIPLPTHKQTNPHPAPRLDITVAFGEKNIKMNSYPTLRRGITHPSNLTERSLHDLPTVLCNTTISHEQIRTALGQDTSPDRLQGIVIPNMNYLEWMMGYPKDWTKVKCGHMSHHVRKQSCNYDETPQEPAFALPPSNKRARSPKVKRTPNCMHLFMKDTPGKDVRQVALIWRDLPDDQKEPYRKRAADLANAAAAANVALAT